MAKINIQNKKIVVVAVTTVLIIVILALVVMKMMLTNLGENVDTPVSVDEVRSRASEYAENGDIDKAMAVYDQQIKQEDNSEHKTKLLVDKAHFAASHGKYDEAVAAGSQAIEIGSDLSAALALAKAYEAKGDKEQAIKYYQILADASGEGGEARGRDGNRWQLKLEELNS